MIITLLFSLLTQTVRADYCSASGGCGGPFPSGDYNICDVQVGGINNTGTGCDGYADYTSLSTVMEIGTAYTITVVNGNNWLWEETCGIWADWNQDGDFYDAEEEIIVSGGPKTFTATITPPTNANLGDTRMRIRLRKSGEQSPCGDTTYGEVEDYTINVTTPAAEYCQAIGGTGFCIEISKFQLKTIDNSSGCEQYADYTSISTELEIGTGYPVFVVTDGGNSRIWVDWNQDFDFDDPNEQINLSGFSYKDPPYGNTTVFTNNKIGMITPPAEAALGATMLRIRSGFDDLNPCGTNVYGEVEDYTVIITESGQSGEEPYGGGQGIEQVPFLIYTAEQMQAIGENNYHWAKHFKLMADIDLIGYAPDTFNIIGDYIFKFTGTFDGNGHTISNFTYSVTDEHRIGIFGEVSDNAVIKNLGLVNPNIQSPILEGQGIGALVGILKGGTISNCYVRGGSVSGEKAVGGLVGGNHATVENCYSRSDIFGDNCVGGLVGYMLSGQIRECYSAARVLGSVFGYGGLIGCVAAGTTVNSFWDMEICMNSAGGTGKTTLEMMQEATFTNWDFTTPIWKICEGTNCPKLAWQAVLPGDFVCPDGVDMKDYTVLADQWQRDVLASDIAPDGGDGIVNLLDWAVVAGGWDVTTDIDDVAVLAEQWLQLSAYCADIAPSPDGDGTVDWFDLKELADNWLEGIFD